MLHNTTLVAHNSQKDWTGNSKAIFSCVGASSHSNEARADLDFYSTDPIAASWLLNIEKLNARIWEPACGAGHLSEVFEIMGHEVRSTDLADRGYGETGINFLACTDQYDGDIVTNPPYAFAKEFVNKALELVPVGAKVCMFLRLQFLESEARRDLFSANPPARVHVAQKRINCYKNGNRRDAGSAVCYAWFVWEKGHKGPTELKWFN